MTTTSNIPVFPRNLQKKIYVAGHNGMVGSAIVRRLAAAGYRNILTASRHDLDLTNQGHVKKFISSNKPDFIFIAAAKVGGIEANLKFGADFIYENLMIQINLIHAAWQCGIRDLQFLGSSCIYPRECSQPISEDYLLTGPLEKTNEPYAIAKIAGLKMCEAYNKQYGTNYRCLMPTNLYGPNDNFDLTQSHVLPALLRKAHEAKLNSKSSFVVWGSGKPRREFLFVDDLADACVFLMENGDDFDLINVGTGKDITISELANLIKDVVGFEGSIIFDATKPDGTPQKLLNIDKLEQLGWAPKIGLREGIEKTYQSYLNG